MLCHDRPTGGFGNYRDATTPSGAVVSGGLAITLTTKAGFAAFNPQGWPDAFTSLQNFDTDQDGKNDSEELKAAEDPNDPTPGAQICGPVYGCVRVARGKPVDGVALVTSGAVLFAGIALLRRRLRR
jgi:hypothetical protein